MQVAKHDFSQILQLHRYLYPLLLHLLLREEASLNNHI